jgi:hypothetical protein
MNNTLEKNNYMVVDNFITEQEAKNLYDKFKEDAKNNPTLFIDGDDQCPLSLSIYNYKWFLDLLANKCSFISELIEEPVLPTYSYARLYAQDEILIPHKDRPSCEISVTLNLGGDQEWPIYIKNPEDETKEVILKPGQAMIYLGCNATHWRKSFDGTECGQVFLHYVRLNGDNWNYCFDYNPQAQQQQMG